MFDFNLENVLETLGKGDSISMTRAEFVRDVPKALFLGYLLSSTGCSGGRKKCSTPEAAFFTLMNRLKNGELGDLDELLLNGAEHDLFYVEIGLGAVLGLNSDKDITLRSARAMNLGPKLKNALSNTEFDITRRGCPYMAPYGKVTFRDVDHFTDENVVVLNRLNTQECLELVEIEYCVDTDVQVPYSGRSVNEGSLEFIRVDNNWRLHDSIKVIPRLLAIAAAA